MLSFTPCKAISLSLSSILLGRITRFDEFILIRKSIQTPLPNTDILWLVLDGTVITLEPVALGTIHYIPIVSAVHLQQPLIQV